MPPRDFGFPHTNQIMTDPPDILICECALGGTLPRERLDSLMRALRDRGVDFAVTPDLCALAATKDGALARWADRPGIGIVACRPRAVRCLFQAAGLALDGEARLVDLRDADADDALRRLGVENAPPPPQPGVAEPVVAAEGPAAPTWFPWFPAIDRERCTSCGQCAEFCLFGVYTIRDGRVVVEHPERCKPHCPACARICPQAAIIFPKHDEAPIDGAPMGSDEEAERPRPARPARAARRRSADAALAERRRRARSRFGGRRLRRCARALPTSVARVAGRRADEEGPP
jgi:NAD-dependent dihydropyrimidine dehydrogenase PreA subunit